MAREGHGRRRIGEEKIAENKGNPEVMDLRPQPIEPGVIQVPTMNVGQDLGPIKANYARK